MNTPIFLGPREHPLLSAAAAEAGADLVTDPAQANALIWTDPFDVKGLRAAIGDRTRWVSLPVAGVDRYVAAGIITADRQWTATKGTYGNTVGEHAVALLLACNRHLIGAARRTTWVSDPGRRLRGQTVAILGTGGIGGATARMLAPFGVRTIGVNRSGTAATGFDTVAAVSDLDSVLFRAQAAIVGLPYTEQTRGLLGERELSALGADGVLINVARGEIVDSEALLACLTSGRLGAAALDVTDPEPLPDGHPLWSLPNVLITPHTANPFVGLPWEPNVEEYADHIRRNVAAFASGAPLEGLVDTKKGY
ncbi:NAD(P)-dependent oxidoreductase [Nocardia sp. NPDC052278]|uniref:NAD(P)-dependent oxidoreductase n=1 Tax=unclassified Nocardia TaxID=2637762 RepID=UPI0036888A3B